MCPHFFLPKSEDYSILSLSPRNREGWWLLGRLRGLPCFCLQFSESQQLYSKCSPGAPLASQICLSHRCHAYLRGEIGSPSDFAWYFRCPAFSVSSIFRSRSLHRESKPGSQDIPEGWAATGKSGLKWNISVLQSNSGISKFFVHHWKKSNTCWTPLQKIYFHPLQIIKKN